MDMKRNEILPGVYLTALKTDKFKTSCMSVSFLTQLNRETAAMNAVIPMVLRRGTQKYPDMDALAARLDDLYGTAIEPSIRRIGEIQCVGFFASFPESRYLPEKTDIMAETAQLLAELLLTPNTRGGLLLPDYVESEKEKLLEIIHSRINDKQSYALQRCIEEMCAYEDYATTRYGDEESARSIHYTKLTKHYRNLISTSPMEIFYCGSREYSEVCATVKDAFAALPRGEINDDIGTEIRMNAVEDAPRETIEELNVSQGKLVMGFRLGECMEEPDLAAIRVFNTVYGGGVTSKLFENVREKLSLCYYASSLLETHKGLMFVSSGVSPDNFEAAKTEILAQLDAIRQGEVSEHELSSAKSGFASDMRALMDSQGALEGYYLSNAIDGIELDPMELAALAEDVTLQDVVGVAKSVVLDEIYFLKGNSQEAFDDGE